jgi:hypothetical protein
MAPVMSPWLLVSLLILQLLTTVAGLAATLNSTQIRASSNTSDVTQAVKYWEENERNLPSYFDDIGDNFNKSGTVALYTPWMKEKATESPSEYQALGEMTFFAVKAMGTETTFKCSVAYRGCRNIPSTETIIQHFMRNKTLSQQEAMEMSRRVNFVFTRVNTAQLETSIFHVGWISETPFSKLTNII